MATTLTHCLRPGYFKARRTKKKRKSAKEKLLQKKRGKRGNVRETGEDRGSTLCDLSAFLPFQQHILFLHWHLLYLVMFTLVKITIIIKDKAYPGIANLKQGVLNKDKDHPCHISWGHLAITQKCVQARILEDMWSESEGRTTRSTCTMIGNNQNVCNFCLVLAQTEVYLPLLVPRIAHHHQHHCSGISHFRLCPPSTPTTPDENIARLWNCPSQFSTLPFWSLLVVQV